MLNMWYVQRASMFQGEIYDGVVHRCQWWIVMNTCISIKTHIYNTVMTNSELLTLLVHHVKLSVGFLRQSPPHLAESFG